MSAADAAVSTGDLQMGSAIEAVAVSCEIVGFPAFVDCVHTLLQKGMCSAKVSRSSNNSSLRGGGNAFLGIIP